MKKCLGILNRKDNFLLFYHKEKNHELKETNKDDAS